MIFSTSRKKTSFRRKTAFWAALQLGMLLQCHFSTAALDLPAAENPCLELCKPLPWPGGAGGAPLARAVPITQTLHNVTFFSLFLMLCSLHSFWLK